MLFVTLSQHKFFYIASCSYVYNRQVQEADTQIQELTSQVSEAKSELQAKVSQVKQYSKEIKEVEGKNEQLKLQVS